MVTSNGGESRNRNTRNTGESREYVRNNNGEKRTYKSYDKSSKDGYRGNFKDSRYTKDSQNGDKDSKEYKPYRGSSDNRYQKDGRKEYGQNTKSGNRGSYNKNGDSRPGFRNNGGRDNGKPFKKNFGDRNYGNPYDKDKDDDTRINQRSRSSQTKDSKVKEQQPDKIDIINRIEKEKKAVLRKQTERKSNKSVRQQVRPRRTNNIDWTKEYENGSYDDDDLDMYL